METPTLPHLANVSLYRFLQEALTNVAKHAGAERTVVKLLHDAEAVVLSVEDNGRGFDPAILTDPAHPRRGIGLQGMRERIELLDGRIDLHSEPDWGTRILANIPIREA